MRCSASLTSVGEHHSVAARRKQYLFFATPVYQKSDVHCSELSRGLFHNCVAVAEFSLARKLENSRCARALPVWRLDFSELTHRAAEAYASGSYGEALPRLPFGMVHGYDVRYNDVRGDFVTR